MYARLLELTVKPDRKSELIRTLEIHILPMLRDYDGFFDLIPLEVETEPKKFYVMSLWYDKGDAERFHREHFATIKMIYEPFLVSPIIVKLCYVEDRISKNLTAAVAPRWPAAQPLRRMSARGASFEGNNFHLALPPQTPHRK